MTVNWIDSSTLKHHKAAIACTRMMGRHTYDVLATKIKSVHKSFGLSGKVSATVTDNGSNFVKAFATFHFQLQMFPLYWNHQKPQKFNTT